MPPHHTPTIFCCRCWALAQTCPCGEQYHLHGPPTPAGTWPRLDGLQTPPTPTLLVNSREPQKQPEWS